MPRIRSKRGHGRKAARSDFLRTGWMEVPVAVIVDPVRHEPRLLDLVRGRLVLDLDHGLQQVLVGVQQQQWRAERGPNQRLVGQRA